MSLDSRNADLNQKIHDTELPTAVEVLVKDAQKRKRQITLLAISVAFDIILSLGLAYGWHLNHQIAIQAESNRDALVRNCETSNDARSKNKQLWDYILSIPPQQAPTEEQKKRVADFKMFVNDTFAPRDCNQVVKDT